MNEIYDSDGNLIAAIPLSERNLELLNKGAEITIQYRTPQLMRADLGDREGRFVLFKSDDQIRSHDVGQVEAYADLQANIIAQRPVSIPNA